MNSTITTIPLEQLLLTLLPVAIVLVILYRWGISCRSHIYGLLRMLAQLLLIGYALVFIFESDSGLVVLGVLSVMLLASTWIALRTIAAARRQLFIKALIAVAVAGLFVLFFITQFVLQIEPWYLPSKLIPLAGMIFVGAMNSISLAAERADAEMKRGLAFDEAKLVAIKAALIPVVNSLFAVGLVSLPGMMTGQILSGVSPFIAARYQIMVMCMIFAAAGLAAALFLTLARREFEKITTHT